MSLEKKNRILVIRWIIYIVLTLCWMAVIYTFSAKNSTESQADSNGVGMFIGKTVISDFEDWSAEEQQEFAEKWDYPIRKAAHMTEYAVLGFLLVGALIYKRQKYKLNAVASLLVAVVYAVSDEIHQYFVPGRACRLYDVGFDSAGAFVGVLVGTALIAWWNGKLESSSKK